jgi:hypothetical protein
MWASSIAFMRAKAGLVGVADPTLNCAWHDHFAEEPTEACRFLRIFIAL